MALKNILGKKEDQPNPNKDAEVQKLREKFNTIVKDAPKPEAANGPPGQKPAAASQATPGQVQAPAGQDYKYVDPEKAEENERITNLIMQQIKELIEIDNNLNAKNKELENKISENASTLASTKNMVEQFNSRLELIEKNMEKFMGLYEVVTNRFNPFVSETDMGTEDTSSKPLKEGLGKPAEGKVAPKPADPAVVEKEIKEIIEQADVKKLDKAQETIVEDELKKAIETVGPEVADKAKDELSKDISETVQKQVKDAMDHHAKLTNDQLKTAMKDMMVEAVKHIQETAAPVKPAAPITSAAVQQPEQKTEELHPDFHFKLPDGTEIKSVQGLKDALGSLDEAHFKEHVNDEKNDFAEWLRVVLDNDEIADKVAKEKTAPGILAIIKDLP